jgi:hypothetical protein
MLYFFAQHVSNASTFIFRSLRLCVGILLWFDVCWRYVVVLLGWCGIRMQAEAMLQPASGYHTTPAKAQRNSYQSNTAHDITQQISRKLLRMNVLTSETCWALNNEIIKQVTSSWSLFTQLLKSLLTSINFCISTLCIWTHFFWEGVRTFHQILKGGPCTPSAPAPPKS